MLENKMYTSTNTYLTRFSSGTILALLLLSGFLFLIPLASPVQAANGSLPTITVTSGSPLLGGVAAQTVEFGVTNPAANAFAITALAVNAPTGWTITAQGAGSFLANNGFGASSATWAKPSAGTGILPGATDTLSIVVTPATGTYPFSNSFGSTVQDGSASSFYAGPSFTLQVMNPATAITAVTPTTTSYTAGTAALTVTVTETPAQAGLPIVFTAPGYATGTTFSFTPSTATTDSTGKATTTFQPSNKVAGGSTGVKAVVGTSAVTVTSATVNTFAGPPSTSSFTYTATLASDGNDYSTTSASTGTLPTFAGAQFASAGISFSIADAFANPLAFDAAGFTTGSNTWTVTITALSGGGIFDTVVTSAHPSVLACTKGDAGWNSGGTAASPAGTCPSSGTSANIPFNYFQSPIYSTVGKISATVSGTYGGASFSATGNSANLVTSTFAVTSPGAGSGLTVAVPSTATYDLAHVPAGTTVKVTAIVSPVQQGVPVSLYLDHATSYETAAAAKDYGTASLLSAVFSAGTQKITIAADSTGTATATFTVDTVAGSHALFLSNLLAPTNALGPLNRLANSTDFATPAITVAAAPAKFVVKTYYDSKVTAAAKNGATSATLFVNIKIADTYNNPSPNPSSGQIQITLTASSGSLSAGTVYIPSGKQDTNSSFGSISWSLPTAVGTATLTASGVLGGSTSSATTTIGVVSPTPTLSVTSPKPLSGVIYSGSSSVVFSGQANSSLGYASTGGTAVTINSVGYKIDSNKWLQAIISSAYKVTWSLAASMTSGLHTAQFNATDSKGNTVVSASYSVLVDTSAPTITFTTAAGASLQGGQPVVASIVDTLGDLNSTSVKATRNGTAIAATSITVTGTSNPGASVTYTVNINGLGSGTWSITLNAKDLAGNAATPVTIKVVVSVLPNRSFTAPTSGPGSPQPCAQGGFTGACVTWTNNLASTQTVNVWFVWYNAKNQIVAVSLQGVPVPAGASSASFSTQSSLASGAYTVQTFITSSAGSAYSLQYPIPVTL